MGRIHGQSIGLSMDTLYGVVQCILAQEAYAEVEAEAQKDACEVQTLLFHVFRTGDDEWWRVTSPEIVKNLHFRK
uniref:Uncharacterized protein n=1 Tax=Lutzomyia longipalpis TaxID=7200 RepID=A0A1B0FV43_LUTLO